MSYIEKIRDTITTEGLKLLLASIGPPILLLFSSQVPSAHHLISELPQWMLLVILTISLTINSASVAYLLILRKRTKEFENKTAETENWDTQMKRYTLFEFPTKKLVYALKPEIHQHGEPMHYICVSCVDKKQKSTLQPDGQTLHCFICNTYIETHNHSRNYENNDSWLNL